MREVRFCEEVHLIFYMVSFLAGAHGGGVGVHTEQVVFGEGGAEHTEGCRGGALRSGRELMLKAYGFAGCACALIRN